MTCFLVKVNKIQLCKKRASDVKLLEEGWPSQPRPTNTDWPHKNLRFCSQNTPKTKLQTRHSWEEYYNVWLIRGRQSKYMRRQLTNRKKSNAESLLLRKCGVTRQFFLLRRHREKSTPYIADLHGREYSPLERAIWHTHQTVKAFSPAVLFLIAMKAHSQMYKVDTTRIYRDTTLFVIIKIQYHL